MRPVLRPGDLVEVHPCGAAELWPGQIACVAAHDDALLLHRYVGSFGRDGRRFVVTRGDRCPRPDEPVPAERVLGRVACTRRFGLRLPLDGAPGRLLGRLAALGWRVLRPLGAARRTFR